jgi:hypothetical protein
MRAILGILALSLSLWGLSGRAANADFITTYRYTSGPMELYNCTLACGNPITMFGAVSFDFDTSSYSGSLSLAPGDTANLFGPGIYPSTTPNGGYYNTMSGSVTLLNGEITAWSLYGGEFSDFNTCRGGPGCAYAISVSSSPSGDDYTNSSPYPGQPLNRLSALMELRFGRTPGG